MKGTAQVQHDPMAPVPCRIQRVRKETHDTFTLELSPPDGLDEFCFKPGQFNMLYMYGVGEVPISISGDPGDPGKIVHTIRAYGAVTHRMMHLRKGDTIGVRGPFGNHWPVERLVGRDIVLAAGGIGIAPLRPALYYLLAKRQSYGKIILLYGERTPADLIYRPLIETWCSRFDLEVDVTVDSARQGWWGHVGVVTTLIPGIRIDPDNTYVMICGPQVMMYYTCFELQQKKGLTDERIYISMERNMKCGIGFCGHCQIGPLFVCKDGPVFLLSQVSRLFRRREI
jgi:NAD(P)H-flavin reductase